VLTTKPSGVTAPSVTIAPPVSRTAFMAVGAAENSGTAAEISQMWLRNEPPKAPWKKWSHSVYCWASAAMGKPEVW